MAKRSRDDEIEAIMVEHEAGLLRYAGRLLHDPDEARDVVQDAFIALCTVWDSARVKERAWKSWLYRVVHHKAVDTIRKQVRQRDLHQRQAEERPAVEGETFDREQAYDLALRHVGELSPPEQQILLLRLEEDLSYREIAQITGRSVGNVGCLLHHAVRHLSEKLQQEGIVA